jgi:hypothetical protein
MSAKATIRCMYDNLTYPIKSLDILKDVSRNRNLAESLNFRAHHKKARTVDPVDMRTSVRTDHAMKDTSRQNRTPLSGHGRE